MGSMSAPSSLASASPYMMGMPMVSLYHWSYREQTYSQYGRFLQSLDPLFW